MDKQIVVYGFIFQRVLNIGLSLAHPNFPLDRRLLEGRVVTVFIISLALLQSGCSLLNVHIPPKIHRLKSSRRKGEKEVEPLGGAALMKGIGPI